MEKVLSLILAAGKGTRMKSDLIKVLHNVGGKSMIQHVVDNVMDFSSRIAVVIGYQGEKVKKSIDSDKEVSFYYQEEQLGTGHAVLQAKKELEEFDGTVLVLFGDTPLLREESLKRLFKKHQEEKAACTVMTAIVENPGSYGRIIRDDDNNLTAIVEEKDASPAEKRIREINTGVCVFKSNLLLEALDNIDNDNAQGEYYLTDAIAYLSQRNSKVLPLIIEDNREIIGINDRVNLAKAEKVIRERTNIYHMNNGVTIIDPDNTYIDSLVEIGQDTVIYPYTYIEGNSKIASNTIIASHCRIVNSQIGNNANINDHCIITDSSLKNRVNIGPFAYIRPGCMVEDDAKVGDFVELKKASIGVGTKVPHLSYVGDANIGTGTNIGAGTITANYDGENKHKTSIGNDVFIGSNTTLIAPVNVGNRGRTGAGSVVTKDIDEETTVLGVPARKYEKNKN
ncbi:bifunctional UDP-N-acetylglucosamine diphosphorylase/glucosamine-1-phosphate N-acetyltransferase GlmU [Natronospora cellulosivora (SeqCode)]